MAITLYNRLKEATRVNEDIRKSRKSFEELEAKLKDYKEFRGFQMLNFELLPTIDVQEYQRGIMREYEKNPVLGDAIKGVKTVEESLEELAQVNKGIRRILPWRENKEHNERLKQLGELISEPSHLRTSGILMPDNLITTGVEVAAVTFGLEYLALHQAVAPIVMSSVGVASVGVGSLFGLVVNLGRFNPLPTGEARYLDGKVSEFYR